MRSLLITMMVVAVCLAGCSKKSNNQQQQAQNSSQGDFQAPPASTVQNNVVPNYQPSVPPIQVPKKNQPVDRMNTLIAPLSESAAKSNQRILVATIFACQDKSKLTAHFKPNAVEVSSSWWRGSTVLNQQVVASGFWYKGIGYELRGKGKTVLWTVPGREPVACTATR